MKNSIYYFKPLNAPHMNEPNLSMNKTVSPTVCSIHGLKYEFLCADCECLSCETCRHQGPHNEDTHRLVHLEQVIGLVYANQAEFLGGEFTRIRRVIGRLYAEMVRVMHEVKMEGDSVKEETVR